MSESDIDCVERFTPKAEKYAKYRWDYAQQAVDEIFALTGLSTNTTVADIGSGTGGLSRHFVGRVEMLYAVEPNPRMRALAVQALGDEPCILSLNGYSHATTLPSNSVDIIVVGRALHWFDAPSTKIELLRILRPDGWLAVLQVPCLDQPLLDAIRSVRITQNGWDVSGDKSNCPKVPLSFYFGGDDYRMLEFPSTVTESWPQFLGRISSLSPAPEPNDCGYANFEKALAAVYARFSVNGRMTINIATTLWFGRMERTGR